MIVTRTVLFENNNTFRFLEPAKFDQNVDILGTVAGSSNMRIAQGIDFEDANGLTRFSTYIQLIDQTILRDIPDDLNGIYIFENSTNLTPFNISWIYWNSVTERPSFLIQDGFPGRSNIFERSLQIGKEKGMAPLDLNYNVCQGTSLADCDTNATGADLIVEDDIEAFGSIQSHENLFVDGNSFINLIYGSMFQFETNNIITITSVGVDETINDFNIGLSNGFSLQDSNILVVDHNGVYKVDWGVTILDGNKKNFRVTVMINGIIQENTAGAGDTQANVESSLSSTGIIELVQGDEIGLQIANLEGTDDVTIVNANMTLLRVG